MPVQLTGTHSHHFGDVSLRCILSPSLEPLPLSQMVCNIHQKISLLFALTDMAHDIRCSSTTKSSRGTHPSLSRPSPLKPRLTCGLQSVLHQRTSFLWLQSYRPTTFRNPQKGTTSHSMRHLQRPQAYEETTCQMCMSWTQGS